jgi:preprotein translocase subunit SecE
MRKVIQFLQEVRAEFKNISWPKKESLIQLTFVVISISLIISLILGGFDFIFTQSINLIGSNKNVAPAAKTVAPVVTIAPLNLTTPTVLPTIKK